MIQMDILENQYKRFLTIRIESLFLFILCVLPFIPLLIMIGMGSISTSIAAMFPVFLTIFLITVSMLKFLSDKATPTLPISILDVLVTLYLAIGTIQIFNPNLPHLGYGFRGFHEHFFWVLFYFAARFVYSFKISSTRRLLLSIYLISLVSVLFGIILLIGGVETILKNWAEYQISLSNRNIGLLANRSIGMFGSPFSAGLFSSLGLGAIISLNREISVNKICYYVSIAIFIAGIVAASSRSVILGTAVALLLFVQFARYINLQTLLIKLLTAALFLGTLLIACQVYLAHHSEHILIKRLLSFTNVNEEPNVQIRYTVWDSLSNDIQDNPFGYGTGALGSPAYRYGKVISQNIADNNYIAIIAEQGVLGLLTFVGIVIATIIYAGRLILKNNAIGWFSLYIVILNCGASIGAPPLKAYPSNVIFWATIGALNTIYFHEIKQQGLQLSWQWN